MVCQLLLWTLCLTEGFVVCLPESSFVILRFHTLTKSSKHPLSALCCPVHLDVPLEQGKQLATMTRYRLLTIEP